MTQQIKGQTALVTGATSGIGLELARGLAERGYRLVLVSRSAEKLRDVAESLRERHGVDVTTYAVDLADEGSARRLFDLTEEQRLGIDVLVNNAGVGVYGEHASLGVDEVQRMLQLNVSSLAELTLLYGRAMKGRGRGRILNVASSAAYQPAPFFAAYGASKSFVLNFSEAVAKELEDFGVTVSCLSPGPTDTGFFNAFDAHNVGNEHLGRGNRGDARDVAEVGLRMMFAGKLSRVVGLHNFLTTLASRFAPRALVARISKQMLRPRQLRVATAGSQG